MVKKDNNYWRLYKKISKLRPRLQAGVYNDYRDQEMINDLWRAEGYLNKGDPRDIETAQMYVDEVEQKLMRSNPEVDFDWDAFAEGASDAFWANSYASMVEELNLESDLAPGAGGDWMDVLPAIPESAEKLGQELKQHIKARISDDLLNEVDANYDEEGAGFYAAMQAMGHGAGWFDVGIDDGGIIPHMEYDVDLYNDTYEAIRNELEGLNYSEDEIEGMLNG